MFSNKRTLALLLVLILTAYWLRVSGAQSSIAYIGDTQLIRQAMEVGQRLVGSQQYNTDFSESFKYPLTLTFYLTGIYGVIYTVGQVIGIFNSVQQFQNYLFINREFMHLIGVYGFNLISIMLIPALFIASRKLNPRHTGWLAACLGAFNLLLIHFGHQPRPHIPLATLAFISTVLLTLVVKNKGGWKVAFAATVVSAATLGTLQSGIVIVLPFLLAWLLRPMNKDGYKWRQLFHPFVAANMICFGVLSVLLYPALVQEYGSIIIQFLTGQFTEFKLGGGSHGFSLSMFNLRYVPQFISNIISYQPLLTLLIPLSIPYFIYVNRRAPRMLLVALGFPLVNLLVWSLFQVNLPRYTAVLSPFFIFVTAYLLEDTALWLASKMNMRLRLIQFSMFGLILVPLVVTALRFVFVVSQMDTRTGATAWIIENLPEAETLLTNFQMYELYPTNATIQRQSEDYPASIGTFWQWLSTQQHIDNKRYNIFNGHLYWRSLPDNGQVQSSFVQIQNIRYIVAVTNVAAPTTDTMINYAQQHGQLIVEFCPGYNLAVAELPDDLFVQGWRQIWQLERPGPFVVIYDLQLQPGNPPDEVYCDSPVE